MWTRWLKIVFGAWLICVLWVVSAARAQEGSMESMPVEGQLTLETPINGDVEVPTPLPRPYQLSATLDLQARESNIGGARQSGVLGEMRELSLGVGYRALKELRGYVEASVESAENQEAQFYLREAYLEGNFERYGLSVQSFRVGQFYYPVGWLTKEDTYFSSQPSYYRELYKGEKGIDRGLTVRVQPLPRAEWKDLLTLEASCFEGRVFRASDQRHEAPARRPCAFGMRSQYKKAQIYYTHFTHDLAFYDAVTANGVGVRWEAPVWESWRVSGGLWGEYWWIRSIQEQGPETLTQGGFAYPYVDAWRFRLGYRWAPTRTRLSYKQVGSVESQIQDDLLRAEFRVFEPLRLIYEDQRVRQRDSIEIENGWSLRLLFRWEQG